MPATETKTAAAAAALSPLACNWLRRATPCSSGADRLELVGVRAGTSIKSMGLTGLVKKVDGFRFVLTAAGETARTALI